jgi:hypothetical protein
MVAKKYPAAAASEDIPNLLMHLGLASAQYVASSVIVDPARIWPP